MRTRSPNRRGAGGRDMSGDREERSGSEVGASMGSAEAVELRRCAKQLALAAAGYLVVQVVIIPMGRWWSWDEAISISQVARGVVAADFDPWRFRGVSLIAAPPAFLGAPSTIIRLWLAAASALALFGSFRVWLPVLGRATAAAAFIFAGSWLAIAYGSEAMPNLWSAFCGVAAVGAAVRREERSAIPTAAALAAMALFRLPDAVVLSVVLSVAAIIGRRTAREYLTPLVGAAAGGLIWALDAGIRFGLPRAILIAIESQRSERLLTVTGPARRLLAYFGWIGTNVPPTRFEPETWSLVSWGLVAAIAIIAAWRYAGPVRLAVVSAITLAVPYLLLVGPIVPRYLLPALGLLSVGAAAGIAAVTGWMQRLSGDLVRGAAAALAIGLLLANVSGARRAVTDIVEFREIDRSSGEWVTRTLGDPLVGECTLLVVGNAPALGMATPCRSRLFYPPGDAYEGQSATSLREAVEVADAGGDAYIVRVWPGPLPDGVTLEPLDGSNLAELYRILPPDS